MTTEQFANNAATTLNGTINASVTTLIASNTSSFPATPQFRIIIDSEIMLVTGVSGGTSNTIYTVTRGAENTTSASHTTGATISMILTAGAMNQAKLDAVTVRTLSSVKAANYTLSSNDDVVLFNTSSNSFTISFPTSPTVGENHIIVDIGGAAATNPLTISGNGNNIVTHTGNTAATDTVGNNYASTHYIYNGTNWSLMRSQSALGTRITPDANDVAVWTFQESAAPFANSGSGSTDSIQLISGTTNPQASGLVLPYSLQSGIQAAQLSTTTTNSATDTAIEPNGAITISLWCKMLGFNASGSAQHLLAKLYRPYSAWTSPFVSVEITLASNAGATYSLVTAANGVGDLTTTNTLTLGEWSHLGFSWDGTTLKQFVNGAVVASAAYSGTIDYGTHGPWIFGQNPAYTAEGNFVGLIQDVRIANVGRPASYFRTVYRAGVGLSLP